MPDDAPLDPFAGDPSDPASELAAFDPEELAEPVPPLTPLEQDSIVDDLADLDIFDTLLSPRGVRGLVVDCADCAEEHFFGWELLRANLRHLLDQGAPRVHEPAFNPDPHDYVTWEYARGYVDGIEAADEAYEAAEPQARRADD